PQLEEFPKMELGRTENIIRYTASLLWIYGQRGQEAKLGIPLGDKTGNESLLYVRPALEFLSVFDPRHPAVNRTMETFPPSIAAIDVIASVDDWSLRRR